MTKKQRKRYTSQDRILRQLNKKKYNGKDVYYIDNYFHIKSRKEWADYCVNSNRYMKETAKCSKFEKNSPYARFIKDIKETVFNNYNYFCNLPLR
jgi:hypothetical protein